MLSTPLFVELPPGGPLREEVLRIRSHAYLMRVEGKNASLECLLDAGVLSPGSASAKTRAVEVECGWEGPQLYFYVACALPEFGNIAIAIQPDRLIESKIESTSTPFDSGGMAAGHLKLGPQAGKIPDRTTLVNEHRVPQDRAHRSFPRYLQDCFEDATHYFRGQRPTHCDPLGLFQHPKNDCRAWVWEVQSPGPFPIDGIHAWCMTHELRESYLSLVEEEHKYLELFRILPNPIVAPNGTNPATHLMHWQLLEIGVVDAWTN